MGGRGGDPKDKYWRKFIFLVIPLTSLTLRRRVDVSASQCLIDRRVFNDSYSFHPHYDGRYSNALLPDEIYKC